MIHEKVIKREDGKRIKIIVRHWHMGGAGDDSKWDVDIEICNAGKRNFTPVVDRDCYTYRGLSREDKTRKDRATFLQYASRDEIHSAMLELWHNLKPKPFTPQ